MSPTRTLRVLHIEYGVGFGGSAISLAELVRGLRAETPVRSVVLSFQARGLNEEAYVDATVVRHPRALSYQTRSDFEDGLRARGVPAPLVRVAMKAYALAFWAYERRLTHLIAGLVREHGIDLIHVNNFWEWSAVRAAMRTGVPCVIHFRGFALPQPTTIAERFGPRVDAAVRRYLCISDAVADATRAFGAPPEKVVTIPNPVTVAPYVKGATRREEVRSRHGFGPAEVVAGVFGRVTSWKGQVEFLEAMVPVMDAVPELRILVVGDESDAADKEYRDRLHALAEAPALAGRVILAGFQSDVAAYYAACDLVVHCSRTPEPFGRVVIEGMAASRPLVAMAEGGPREIITDGVDGVLVPPRDGPALAAAVVALARDPERRLRLGRAAFDTVRARYSAEAIARLVHAQYLEALR